MEWTIILEKGEKNWSSYCPDLPGCAATGKTKRETVKIMREAISFHIKGMLQDNETIPKPISYPAIVRIST